MTGAFNLQMPMANGQFVPSSKEPTTKTSIFRVINFLTPVLSQPKHPNTLTRTMTRPQPGEYAPYFDRYIALTRGADAIQNLEDSALDLYEVLAELDDEKGEFAYARDKWSIVQMIRHLIDTDMVFTYRALYFCRNQGGELAGYDHEA